MDSITDEEMQWIPILISKFCVLHLSWVIDVKSTSNE